jgi:two-component system sensor histidine kinase YesM
MKGSRITLLYLFFGIVSVLLIGFVLYFSLSTVMMNEAIAKAEVNVNQSGKYLEVYIDRLKTTSDILAKNEDVVDLFSDKSESTKDHYMNRISHLIDNTLISDNTLNSIIIISKDGNVFSNEENLDMSMSEDMMKEDWYVQAIHNDMPTLTSARMQKFSMDKDLWVISLSQEIVDENENNLGVVVLDVPYTSFENFLMELQVGEDGFAFILNDLDEVVFHQDTSFYEDEAKQQELIQLKNSNSGNQLNSGRLINHYSIEGTDWTLVAISSVDTLTVIKRQILETILLGSGLIFMGVLITSVILRRLTSEIQQQEMDIHHYEMNALYSQINPHFLYNTLDTIVWMAEFNQSEDVIKTTKSLAQFFRLSLNQGKELTSIKTEIEHVKQYLYIQKQRYQEKLNYSFDIDESLLNYQVPKIILQPIVENSIYHGIKNLDTEGHIEISIQQDVKDILIKISDDGVGFDKGEESITELPKSQKTKLGGIGLKNVHKRIHLYCGDGYGATIESTINVGTIVTLRVCKKEKSDDKST